MCRAWLRLRRTPGLGTQGIARIVNAYGDAESFIAAPAAEQARYVRSPGEIPGEDDPSVKRDLEWLGASEQHHVLSLVDSRYPASLRALQDPPPLLYVTGDPALLARPQISVVGSRKPTRDGTDNAHDFARHLAAMGLVVTSGLALGVDGAAHRGALEGGGPTIAVVATGPERVYPARNAELARSIAGNGAVVSELPVGTGVRREHFPRRNRVISGLAMGVLVVEAGVRSGSLITARHALEQGREVFAIPGSIHNPLARGCHRLIREGAKIVECAGDILEELPPLAVERPGAPPDQSASPALDADHIQVLEALGDAPQPLDTLAARTGLTPDTLSSILLLLELEGFAETRPGGRYARAGRSGWA